MIGCADIAIDDLYVINLERQPHRLRNMRATFDKHRVPDIVLGRSSFTVMEAEDFVDKSSPVNFNGPRNGGAYGCTLSHLKVIDDALAKGHETVLVMEDDVMVHHRFRELWTTISVPDDFSILYLSATQLKWGVVHLREGCPYYKACKSLGGTAYVLKGRKIMLDIKRLFYIYKRPIDELLIIAQETHPCYVLYPNLLINYMDESNIRKNNKWKIETTGRKILRWDTHLYDTTIILPEAPPASEEPPASEAPPASEEPPASVVSAEPPASVVTVETRGDTPP